MSKIFHLSYDHIISVENLLDAWREFVRNKSRRHDVLEFEFHLMDKILILHRDLASKNYRHQPYEFFQINDPKPRDIHKATAGDRLVHHAIYRSLYWFYHQVFIPDSFSCRLGKGTHRAINRLRTFSYQASQNHSKTLWVLKCDIRKFFATIDQEILLGLLKQRIPDLDIIWLLEQMVHSFHSAQIGVGLPLGNLTSQLFVNIYMNEFDQFMKRKLKVKHYLRYADDFVLLSDNRQWLEKQLLLIDQFLAGRLKLTLHPDKISIQTAASGVDFLGWVNFPDHRVLRIATKNRMFRNIRIKEEKRETVESYLGLLKHGNAVKLSKQVLTTARSMGIDKPKLFVYNSKDEG
ncbi:MAG: reverse transcriptase/maturase family protein [Candidatus Vogelbacteria bacterium]